MDRRFCSSSLLPSPHNREGVSNGSNNTRPHAGLDKIQREKLLRKNEGDKGWVLGGLQREAEDTQTETASCETG